MQVIVDEEFKKLIPPLSPEERDQLRDNLNQDGCRDPLVIWKGHNILVDGHNRHEICQLDDIPFKITTQEFDCREAVKIWIIHNQMGRRSITDGKRALLGAELMKLYSVQAKARQLATQNNDRGRAVAANLPQQDAPGKARDQAAAAMNVSARTVQHAKTIEENAVPAIRELVEADRLSVSAAAEISRLEPTEQCRIAGLSDGKIKEAIAKLRAKEKKPRWSVENDAAKLRRIIDKAFLRCNTDAQKTHIIATLKAAIKENS